MPEEQQSIPPHEIPARSNFLSRLRIYLNALWLFSPGMLLVLIGLFALTGLEQGRDLVVTSVESIWAPGFSLAAVSFWAFISWYTARLVSHEKIRKTGRKLSGPFRYIPRAIGFSCYLVFEISILNLRFFQINFWLIFPVIVIINVILILYGIKLIKTGIPVFEKWPFRSFIIILVSLMITMDLVSGLPNSYFWRLFILFLAHLLMGLLFVNFTYFRRIYLDRKRKVEEKAPLKEQEEDFLAAFIAIVILGFIIYFLPVISPGLAAWVGSLNFVMTGLGIMLVIGNFLAFYSVRSRINLHLFVFLGLLIAGFLIDPYQINTICVDQPKFRSRETLDEYFNAWYARNRTVLDDTSQNRNLPVYVSLADGGASRSGYWVAQVLGTLEDSISISKNLLCISGASGGSVGNLSYYSLLVQHRPGSFREASARFLSHDFLTFTLSRMLSPAYFFNDRGNALEKALVYGNHDMSNAFSGYTLKDHDSSLPIIFVNTTRMQDSHPGVVTNIRFDPAQLNNRLDVLHILDSLHMDIRVSSVAILSSRFPYVSPAGGIGNDYFVDGGYFDNSGAGAAHETILSLMKFLKENHPNAIPKIRFKVIHISNSVDTVQKIKRVNPIVNDLAAPLKVLMASYGQQTEINTLRLQRYLEALGNFNDSTDWYDINLYAPHNYEEYSMSWYMSDDCRNRIDDRLKTVTRERIHDLITDFRTY